ncbi:MAG: LacI family transcriptional regulator, partial [Sphingobacteriaceae bacterium]
AASTLKSRRSFSLGVMVADVANSFFSQSINGIESVAYEQGYNVIITQSHDSYEREVTNIQHLANRSVDGLLISMSAQTTNYEHIEKLHAQGLPIVFFDRILPNIDTFKVTSDNYKASFDTTERLIKKGHKKIAHLANAPQLSITIDRLAGYKAALEKHQLPYLPELVRFCVNGGRELDEVEAAILSILSGTVHPDALFITSDRIIIAALRVVNNMPGGLGLPIVGFSNSDVIDLLTPRISYVRQSAFEMGQIATQMLIKLIESKYPLHIFETRLLEAKMHFVK